MKRFIVIFIITLLSLPGFSQISPVIKKFKNDTIVWNADTVLSFDDFTGKLKKRALGMTVTTIFLYNKEVDGQLRFYVEAIFIKSKSFIEKTSEYVLKHEQLHFDICELFARKLRQKIAQKDFKKVKNIGEVINNMYQRIFKEFEAMQIKYDSDTEHGRNAAKQKVWEDNIALQLKDLGEFSSTEVNTVR